MAVRYFQLRPHIRQRGRLQRDSTVFALPSGLSTPLAAGAVSSAAAAAEGSLGSRGCLTGLAVAGLSSLSALHSAAPPHPCSPEAEPTNSWEM